VVTLRNCGGEEGGRRGKRFFCETDAVYSKPLMGKKHGEGKKKRKAHSLGEGPRGQESREKASERAMKEDGEMVWVLNASWWRAGVG